MSTWNGKLPPNFTPKAAIIGVGTTDYTQYTYVGRSHMGAIEIIRINQNMTPPPPRAPYGSDPLCGVLFVSTVYVEPATQPPNFRPIVAKGKQFFSFLYTGFIIEKLKILGTGGFCSKMLCHCSLTALGHITSKTSDAHTGCHLT